MLKNQLINIKVTETFADQPRSTATRQTVCQDREPKMDPIATLIQCGTNDTLIFCMRRSNACLATVTRFEFFPTGSSVVHLSTL